MRVLVFRDMKDVFLARTHYEAGWTDSWSHRRCFHKHRTPSAAAKCSLPYGAYGYVFAVKDGVGRELRATEENIVHAVRFKTASKKESVDNKLAERVFALVADRPSV